eukprot:gene30241-36546_t
MSGDWDELFSEKHKRKYWKNKKTGETSWKDPNAAISAAPTPTPIANSEQGGGADEWEELYNEKHKRKYWKNKVTGKSSWTPPSAASNAPHAESKSETPTPSIANSAAQEGKATGGDWVELFSEKHKKKYWKNNVTGKTSWTPPTAEILVKPDAKGTASGSDEWEELFNEKHKRKYWKNKVTGKTSWTPPTGNKDPTPSAAVSPLTVVSEAHTLSHAGLWEELYSEKHKRKYWKNKETGKISWTKPVEDEAASVAPSKAGDQVTASAESKSEEWVEGYSEKHKRKFWKSSLTGKISWTPPPKPVEMPAKAASPAVPAAQVAVVHHVRKLVVPVQLLQSNQVDKQFHFVEMTLAEQMTWRLCHFPAQSSGTGKALALKDAISDAEFAIAPSTFKVIFDQKQAKFSVVAQDISVSHEFQCFSHSAASTIWLLLKHYEVAQANLLEEVRADKGGLHLSSSASAIVDSLRLSHLSSEDVVQYATLVAEGTDMFVTGHEASAAMDNLNALRQQLMKTIESSSSQVDAPFRPSILVQDNVGYLSESSSTIPLSGIHVIHVTPSIESADGLPPASVDSTGSWTPCWVSIDQFEQTI